MWDWLSNNSSTLQDLASVFSAVAVPIVVALIGQWAAKAIESRNSDVKLIELAVQTLVVDPKDNPGNAALRDWSVKVLQKYSDIEIETNDRDTLRKTPVRLSTPSVSTLSWSVDGRYKQLKANADHGAFGPSLKTILEEHLKSGDTLFSAERTTGGDLDGWLYEGMKHQTSGDREISRAEMKTLLSKLDGRFDQVYSLKSGEFEWYVQLAGEDGYPAKREVIQCGDLSR